MSKKTRASLRRTLLTLSLVLVVAFAAVGGTLAWLTSVTGPVTNTFTVGDVKITLDEAPVDLYGKVVSGDRRTENQYKLVPSHNYKKDPTVHVAANSEESYVFVKVENGISEIEKGTTIAEQILAKNWLALEGETGVYYKVVPSNTQAQDLVVFEQFTLKDDADVQAYKEAKITVQAYAIQKDGTESVSAAWKLVKNLTPDAPATGA